MSRARDLAAFVSNADGDIKFDTDTLFIDSSANRVGIGTSSPTRLLSISDTSAQMTLESAAGNSSILNFGDTSDDNIGRIQYNTSTDAMTFRTNTADRMTIDSSGQVLVGTTSTPLTLIGASATRGIGFEGANSYIAAAREGTSLYLNRLNTDGSLLLFRKDGSTKGSVFTINSNSIAFGSGNVNLRFSSSGGVDYIIPVSGSGADRDNAIDLGFSAARFDDIYATNGTIQTSDRNEKQDIAELDEAEKRVATAAKGLIRKYRWIDAVQEKGDDARIHVGIIAQDLQAAFEAEGLDASRYAMFISSTWWETDEVIPAVEAREAVYETQTDEEGNETQVLVSEAVEAQPERTVTNTYETQEEAPEGATERTRLGVRYPELLAFIIGAM